MQNKHDYISFSVIWVKINSELISLLGVDTIPENFRRKDYGQTAWTVNLLDFFHSYWTSCIFHRIIMLN